MLIIITPTWKSPPQKVLPESQDIKDDVTTPGQVLLYIRQTRRFQLTDVVTVCGWHFQPKALIDVSQYLKACHPQNGIPPSSAIP